MARPPKGRGPRFNVYCSSELFDRKTGERVYTGDVTYTMNDLLNEFEERLQELERRAGVDEK